MREGRDERCKDFGVLSGFRTWLSTVGVRLILKGDIWDVIAAILNNAPSPASKSIKEEGDEER